jgi:hypothetical protein
MAMAIFNASQGLVSPTELEMLESDGMIEGGKLSQKALMKFSDWLDANWVHAPDVLENNNENP